MDSFTIFTWTLTAVTIAGTYLNSKQNKYGFLVWGLCNMLWLGVDFTRGIYAQAALYVVFIGFNIYGWKQWGKKDSNKNKWTWTPYGMESLESINIKLNKFLVEDSVIDLSRGEIILLQDAIDNCLKESRVL